MFGDALLASLPKVTDVHALASRRSTLISATHIGEKRGWAVCFSAQLYPTPTSRRKSQLDIGMSPGRKASVAWIVLTQ